MNTELYAESIDEINNTIRDYLISCTSSQRKLVPQFVACSELMAEELLHNIPKFASADYISIFKVLNLLIQKSIAQETLVCKSYPLLPTKEINRDACRDFANLHYYLFQLNELVSLGNGYCEVVLENNQDDLRIHIVEGYRRSALNMLGIKCEYLSYSNSIKNILDNHESLVKLQLEMKMSELSIFYNGVSKEWNRFITQCEYSLDDIVIFNGFLTYLMSSEKTWYKYKDLYKLWRQFLKQYSSKEINDDVFNSLLDLYSLTNDKIVEWGIPVAFISFGDWYIYCRYFLRIMDSSLLITLLWQRKKKDLWNTTLGSGMASVANYLARQFEMYDGVLIESERTKKGIGDIDIAVYDTNNSHLLLCEVKTVFDKFRTNYQMQDFRNKKVNIKKANEQLRKNYAAIESDLWLITDIFRDKQVTKPQKISMIILTWWDIFNANSGTEDRDILSCNFKTFSYLYMKSNGNLDELYNAVFELSHIYCPAKLIKNSYNNLNYYLERQTDLLPPKSMIKKINSRIVNEELESLAKFPEDWKEQLVSVGESPESYCFY